LETLECHKLDADIKAFDKTHAALKKDHEQIQREL
jgi:structural maintenance of chromosome 4